MKKVKQLEAEAKSTSADSFTIGMLGSSKVSDLINSIYFSIPSQSTHVKSG